MPFVVNYMDEEKIVKSSSGGIFYALAEKAIEEKVKQISILFS